MLKLFVIAAVLLITTSIVNAHPSDNLQPGDLEWATIWGPALDLAAIGEIKFDFSFPPADTLTHQELYMLAGTKGEEAGFRPWWEELMFAAAAYQGQTGNWPSLIDEDVVSVLRAAGWTEDSIERLKSPITNQFPRLDAADFLAGNVYLRPMTQAETDYIASQPGYLQQVKKKEQEGKMRLDGPPVYVRIYGEKQVIAARFIQITTELGKDRPSVRAVSQSNPRSDKNCCESCE